MATLLTSVHSELSINNPGSSKVLALRSKTRCLGRASFDRIDQRGLALCSPDVWGLSGRHSLGKERLSGVEIPTHFPIRERVSVSGECAWRCSFLPGSLLFSRVLFSFLFCLLAAYSSSLSLSFLSAPNISSPYSFSPTSSSSTLFISLPSLVTHACRPI